MNKNMPAGLVCGAATLAISMAVLSGSDQVAVAAVTGAGIPDENGFAMTLPYLSQLHALITRMPIVTAVGPLLAIFSVVAILYFLRLTKVQRDQFYTLKKFSSQLQKLKTAVENAPSSILVTDKTGIIEYVNPAFCRLTGYSSEEAIGQHTRILKGENGAPEHYREVWETISGGREWRGEFFNRRKDGSVFWEFASISPIRDELGDITHFVAVKENISERKQMIQCLDQLAHFDALTSLPNRALFFDRLNEAISISQRQEQRFALLFVDLDGFKQVNDAFGHDAGDFVLKTTAERLIRCVRESDTVARMGGDEFLIILRNIGRPEDSVLVAEKILTEVASPIELAGAMSCAIGSSIGISLFPDDSTEAARLVSAADSAMYEVKRSGKNGYRFYTK